MSGYNLPRWNYFRILERDLEGCFRYVEPCEKHYLVYSDEFSKLILVACSEIENVLQELAIFVQPGRRCRNIEALGESILTRFPYLPLSVVAAHRYGLKVQPWSDWGRETPGWWVKGYNKLKHDRVRYPEAGTLVFALNALAALEVVLLYLYRHKYNTSSFSIECAPHLLDLEDFEASGLESAFIGWSWELPDDQYAIQKRNRAKVNYSN